MKVKPIGRMFGFWVLVFCAFISTYNGDSVEAAIFIVGAVIFDAIKTIGNKQQ